MKKRLATWIMIAALLLGMIPFTVASDYTSRTFVVESVSGSNATMTKGSEKTFAVRSGTRLATGNSVATGKSTTVGIKMDDNSVVTMAQSTKIDVSKVTNTQLRLKLINGELSVNAGAQAAGNSTSITAGNTTMGIRGTKFTVTYINGELTVVLLEGELDITTFFDSFILRAGETLKVYEGLGTMYIDAEVYRLDLDDLNSFTLEFIEEHLEELLETGIISAEDAERLEELIEERLAEEDAAELERLANLPDIENELIFLPEEGAGTGGMPGDPQPPGQTAINFTCPNFEAAVRLAAGFTGATTGPIYPVDVEEITTLNVSDRNITSLTGIEYFTSLEHLSCYMNQLTVLDLSSNLALEELYASDNLLASVNLSGLTSLTDVQLFYNQLTALDISDLTSLTDMNVRFNQLAFLNASGCTALRWLGANDNHLTSLDVTGLDALQYLDVWNNNLGNDPDITVTGWQTIPALVLNPPTGGGGESFQFFPQNTAIITINTHPAALTTVREGLITGTLTVTASVDPVDTLTYQWFSSSTEYNRFGTELTGETGASLTISTALTAGTYYYYCVVSATGANDAHSNVATVVVEPPAFQINNATELGYVGGGTLNPTGYTHWTMDADYILMNDLPDTTGFTPIGDAANPFTGTLDGGNNTITLSINLPSTNYVGLFGVIDGGMVKDLTVAGSVTGMWFVGGIAGINGGTIWNAAADANDIFEGGDIINCTVTAAVHGEQRIGGITGRNGGSYNYWNSSTDNGTIFLVGLIDNCDVTGTVSNVEYGGTGGIAGSNYGEIIDSSFSGSVIGGIAGNTGGMVGENYADITDSNSTGTVTGTGRLGGITGYMSEGSIINCFATGNVTGATANDVGGIVGYNGAGVIQDCYSTGHITGEGNVGGIAGTNDVYTGSLLTKGLIDNCYSTGTVTGTENRAGGIVGRNFGVVQDSHSEGNVYGGDFVGGVAGVNWSDNGEITNSYSTGDVTGDDYVGGVVGLNGSPTNLGSYTASVIIDSYATGTINGKIYVGGVAGSNGGEVFEYIWLAYEGLIENSRFEGTVHGHKLVGGIAGDNWESTITDSQTTGDVFGDVIIVDETTGNDRLGDTVGGIAGQNIDGTILNCFVTGDVSGYDWGVGGIVGWNRGGIVDACYTAGDVSGITYTFSDGWEWNGCDIGGIAGSNGNDGIISNCYSMGSVTGRETVGGVAGSNSAIIENCYAIGFITGDDIDAGGIVGFNGGDGEVYNSVALNTGVILTEGYKIMTIGRIAGDSRYYGWGAPVLSGNYARSGLPLYADDLGTNNMDGANVPYAQYSSQVFWEGLGWDFNDIWGWNGTMPVLANTGGTQNHSAPADTPAPAGPFEIRTVADLKKIGTGQDGWTLTSDYILMNDIDAAGGDYEYNVIGSHWTPFNGVFDGNGYKITLDTDLGFRGGMRDPTGFIGMIGSNGVVRNLEIAGRIYIEGSWGRDEIDGVFYECSAGGIAGRNQGTIENCLVTADVTGIRNFGGVVGYNDISGVVRNCYVTGNVVGVGSAATQLMYIAGLVGINYGTIENSVALNQSITSILGSNGPFGRVTSLNSGGTLTNNHARDDLAPVIGGAAQAVTSGDNLPGGANVVPSTYNDQGFWDTTLGWDFTGIWEWDVGNALPVLQTQ